MLLNTFFHLALLNQIIVLSWYLPKSAGSGHRLYRALALAVGAGLAALKVRQNQVDPTA